MIDIMNICNSLNTCIGTVMKNPEMINLLLIILKLKKCVSIQLKNYLKKLPYLLRYV